MSLRTKIIGLIVIIAIVALPPLIFGLMDGPGLAPMTKSEKVICSILVLIGVAQITFGFFVIILRHNQ